jgi:competence protein ComEC
VSLKDIELEHFSTRRRFIDQLLRPKGNQPRFQSGDGIVARPIIDGAVFARRRIVLIPFALILGICIYVGLPAEPPIWLYPVLAAVLLVGAFLVARQWLVQNLLLLAAFVALGVGLMSSTAAMRGTTLLAYPTAGTVAGEVRQLDMRPDANLRLVLRLSGNPMEALSNVRLVRLTIDAKHYDRREMPRIGQILEVRARFIPVPKPVYPGGYDPQFHSYFDGIGAYGSTLEPIQLRDSAETKFGWDAVQNLIFDARHAIAARFTAAMAPRDAAIARALIIGDQSAIAPELRDEIAVSGLAHLLAISGLHLSLVAGGIFFTLRFLLASPIFPLAVPGKMVAALAAMVAALFYLGISGANIATQRATIMLIIAFVAVLLGRRAITLRNVALVCILMIVLYPNEVFKPGFQLSFAAVGALVGVYEWSKSVRQVQRWPGWARFFGGLSLTSLVAGIATAPIAAVHFSQFAPFGLFANLVAVPLVGFFVLPTLIFACVSMPLGLEAPILQMAGWGIEQVIAIAKFFTHLGGAWTYVSPLQGWVLPLCGLALMMFLILKSALRFVPPLIASVLITLLGAAPSPDILVSDQTRSVFLKQGEGNWAQVDRIGNNFTTRVWAEWLGVDLENQTLTGHCDRSGCIATVAAQEILLARDKIAVWEDCGLVNLIVEQDYLYQSCSEHSQMLRHWDVRRFGTAAIYYAGEAGGKPSWRVRHAVLDPTRPWRIAYDD